MNRFRQRLDNAEARINRAFAEEMPALLQIGTTARPVTIIFEAPDAPVVVTGGGEIQDYAPAFSALTADLVGLDKSSTVQINGEMYRVTHIGTSEEGRTRVSLGYGEGGRPVPEINNWS